MQASDPPMTSRWASIGHLIPGPSDVVFAVVLGLILIGKRQGLFDDPGTAWHLRLGREILATGAVPRQDTLTFTRLGVPWVNQSWGFDVLLAFLVDHAGWSAVIALTAVGLAGLYAAMARGLVRDGISPLVAAVVAVLTAAIGSIHFLIRPHLFTFAFFYLTLRACQKQHERGGWSIVVVPLYTAILANLHGGFLALPMIVATAGLGHAISGTWDAPRRRNLLKFAAACGASSLAALANPYGMGLYRHVITLLISSGVTSLIAEYQPAPFGKPDAKVLEWVVLALVGLPVISAQVRPLPIRSRAGLAAPGAHVDSQCPTLRAGDGPGTGRVTRRAALVGIHASVVETRIARVDLAGDGNAQPGDSCGGSF